MANGRNVAVRLATRPVPAIAKISIFDLDRTLTIQPTYSRFLIHCICARAPWRLALIPLLLPYALLYAFGLIGRSPMKRAMHRVALGRRVPAQVAARIADRFAASLVVSGIYPQAFERIAIERARGRRIVIATAAPHLYSAALARRLGIGDVIATASGWANGALIPVAGSANCYGVEKRRMIADWLANAGIARGQAHIRFFSDDASDLPSFEFADEPVAVNPSRRLAAIAEGRGWSVLDWRRAAR